MEHTHETKPMACWHVRDEARLRRNLSCNRCDLWPLEADRGSWERYSAQWWFDKKMKLEVGYRVRFCYRQGSSRVKVVLATGTIGSRPYKLDQPLDQSFRSAVTIIDVQWISPSEQQQCLKSDSHRI